MAVLRRWRLRKPRAATRKWPMATAVDDAAVVVERVFDEAERRDPAHQHPWVALVDGNNHQLDRIRAEAKQRRLSISVVIGFVDVLEYLWGAAWSFYAEGDPDAEAGGARQGSGGTPRPGQHRGGGDPTQGDLPRPRCRNPVQCRHLR